MVEKDKMFIMKSVEMIDVQIMKEAAFFRLCSATEVRQVWSAVQHLEISNKISSGDNVFLEISQSLGWTPAEASSRLDDMVKSGLLLEINQGETVYQIPSIANDELNRSHDWYCFECQGAGVVVCCSCCPRVYHEDCLKSIGYAIGADFVCPCCRLIQSRPAVDREYGKQKFTQVLVLALTKGGSHFTQLPEHSWPCSLAQYRMLVANHMDLDEMQRKIDIYAYRNEKEFLSDFQLLRHNIILMYGADSAFATLVMDLLCDVDAQLDVFARDDGTLESEGSGNLARGEKVDKSESRFDKEKLGSLSKPCNCGIELKANSNSAPLCEWFCNRYLEERNRVCVNYIQKLYEEWDAERDRVRMDMINQFKAELESTKRELDKQYAQKLKVEVQRLMEKHRFEASHTKKTQWCCLCGTEAIYHCCWNTSYCSVKCQHDSWSSHKKSCRRKKDG